MTDTPVVAPKRFSIASVGRFLASIGRFLLTTGRYLLILTIVLIVLFAGFVGRGYVPTNWLPKVSIGSFRLFPAAPEIAQVVASPTATMEPMTGMDHSSTSTAMPDVTMTPSSPDTSAGGVVTVVTLTPTPVTSPTQEPATALPQTGTPSLTATAQPTKTLQPTLSILEVSVEMIRMDLDDLHRILETTTIMTETFRRGQPTEAELAALKAQLNVIDQRMERLAAEFQLAEATGETDILLGQATDLLDLMRQAVGIVQSVLAGPTIDSAILNQTQDILEQLLAMVNQLQDLTTSVEATIQNTPTAAAATAAPTSTATPAAISSNQLDQMQSMLSQMIDQLGVMQGALDQKQAQPGTTPVP